MTKQNSQPIYKARERGKKVTTELIGRQVKCKFCQSSDSYVSVKEGRYFVNCPDCQAEYLLKEQT